MVWEIQTTALSFQANDRIIKEREKRQGLCLAQLESLHPACGWKQSTSMSAASLSRSFDFKISSVCAGPAVRWGLLQL